MTRVRIIALACIAAAGCATTAPRTPVATPTLIYPMMPGVIAHRGASRAAKGNTVEAVSLAWQLGAQGVEIDVWVTADGQPVVVHDNTAESFGGRDEPIRSQTYQELSKLRRGRYHMPHLAEVLATVPPGRTLFIEIKSKANTVRHIIDTVRRNHPGERGGFVAFESYRLGSLAEARRLMPDTAHYLLADKPGSGRYSARLIATAKAAGFAGLALDARGLNAPFVAAARAARVEVVAWTANTRRNMDRLRRLGVFWIETDDPPLGRVAFR